MPNIKVSVVMAVYNALPYLHRAIETVRRQTLEEIEIILVDDGSEDGSYEVLCGYARADRRIKVLQHQERTDGAAAARNMGIDAARGAYLAVLDSDDFFELDMLEKAYTLAKSENADMVFWDGWHYDDKLQCDKDWEYIVYRNLPATKDVFTPADRVEYFDVSHGAAWDKLFSRDFIKKEGIRFFDCRYTDDLVFTFEAFFCARRVAVLRERLVHYRVNHAENQTKKSVLWPEIGYKAFYALRLRLEEKGVYEAHRIPLARYHLGFLRHVMLDRMDTLEAFEALYYAMKEEYWKKTGLDQLTDEDFGNREQRIFFDALKNSRNAAEFFIMKAHHPLLAKRGGTWLDQLTARIPAGAKIAVYGAGFQGKRIFIQLLQNGAFPVVSWVDRNWERIGFPVESPRKIKTKPFDFVLIAIENASVASEVKAYLRRLGIAEEKIVLPVA